MKPIHLIMPMLALLFYSCRDRQDVNIETDEKYQSSKVQIATIEQQKPQQFLSVETRDKKNLLGQTVVSGTIFNRAKVVAYKDIALKLRFYSKTGALLEEDVETVYETISAGGSTQFKSKFFAPKSTDSVSATVVSAKY